MNKKQKKKQEKSWSRKRNHVPDLGTGPKKFVIFGSNVYGQHSRVISAAASKNAAKRWIRRNDHIEFGLSYRKCTKDFAAGVEAWGADSVFAKRHPGARFWRHLVEYYGHVHPAVFEQYT